MFGLPHIEMVFDTGMDMRQQEIFELNICMDMDMGMDMTQCIDMDTDMNMDMDIFQNMDMDTHTMMEMDLALVNDGMGHLLLLVAKQVSSM